MPSLITAKQLQSAQTLPFCYVCGELFVAGVARNMDHVPPRACFAVGDRGSPLKLPTHSACNAAYAITDERVGQFMSTIDKRPPPPGKLRIKSLVQPIGHTGKAQVTMTNVNIYGTVERWVRAFHAALYGEPAPPETRFGIQTPFLVAVPSKDRDGPQFLDTSLGDYLPLQ